MAKPKKPRPKLKPIAKPKKPKPKKRKPKKQSEKPKEDELTSLLKSLDESKPEEKEIAGNADYDPTKEMTISEKLAIQNKIRKQVQACWNVPAGARNAEDLVVLVDIDIARDGSLTFVGFTEERRYYSDSFYSVAADSARRAVLDPRCNPLRDVPPLDKYEVWDEITLDFDPKSQIY